MSDDKKLPVEANTGNKVQLHESGLRAGSLIEQSLGRLSPEQTETLVAKAAEEALRLEAKSREQNMDYVVGKKAVEDHIDTFAMLDKSGKLTRQSVVSDVKTGAGNMRIESKSGATCFVASTVFEDPNHTVVMQLRAFRDTRLVSTKAGRGFINWYWRVGPKLAVVVGNSELLKGVCRFALRQLAHAVSPSTTVQRGRSRK
jgi:hypothetical protein